MPIITGTLSDIGLQPLVGLRPRLRFSPSNAAVDGGGRVFTTKVVEVAPTVQGAFSVELAPTTNLMPKHTHWVVEASWLEGQGWSHLPLRIHVGETDASIADTVAPDQYRTGELLHVGVTPPIDPAPGTVWVDTSGEVAVIKKWEA